VQVKEDEFYEDRVLVLTINEFHQQTHAIKGFITIQTCAFLEEYKKFHKILPEQINEKQNAIEFKKDIKILLKPAISLIESSWKDLYEARNTLFAHNWRHNDELVMFSNHSLKPSNSPWIDEEFTLLIGIFDNIIYQLQDYRTDYFDEMFNLIKQKSKIKIKHLSRVQTHNDSLKMVNLLKEVMDQELAQIKERQP